MLRKLMLAAGLCVAAFSMQAQAQTRTVRVAYLKSLSFSPLFAAIERRYFADEGIEVDLQIVQSSSEVVAFLARGQMDVAFGNLGVPFLNGVRNGFDVRLIAGVSYASADANDASPNPIVIAKASEGVLKSALDLKGKKVAVNTRGGIIEYQFARALRGVGLGIGDVELVTMGFPDMTAGLTNNAVAAAIVPEPAATAGMERGLTAELVRNPAPGAMLTVAMIGKNFLEGQGVDTADRFMRALRKASAGLQSRGEVMSPDNLAVWTKYTGIPAPLIAKTRPYTFEKDLAIDRADLKRQQDYLVETKQVPAAIDIDKLIDARHAKMVN